VGAVIVKEKLTEPGDVNPVAIGVMRKGPAGSNPANGDWEFLYFQGGHAVAVGDACAQCHRDRADQDYVFRSYL
jgi:hypothetical protein